MPYLIDLEEFRRHCPTHMPKCRHHSLIASTPSFEQSVQAIRIASNCKTEHQLLPGRRRMRAEFFVPAQVEEAIFRQELDGGPGCIYLRPGFLESVDRSGLDRRGWGKVDLVIGDLPLRVSD